MYTRQRKISAIKRPRRQVRREVTANCKSMSIVGRIRRGVTARSTPIKMFNPLAAREHTLLSFVIREEIVLQSRGTITDIEGYDSSPLLPDNVAISTS